MDDRDLLIQRFLDQDLMPEERVQFLAAVDADSALRRQWLNVEMLVTEAGRFPRIAPSPQFTMRVLQQLDAPPRGIFARLTAWVVTPRTLEWNLAGAMAAACVAAVAIVGLLRFAPERIVEAPPMATPSPAQTASFEPGQAAKVYVRLVLLQPGARSVSVAGDFNGWNPGKTAMERSGGGVWTATIELKPGRYEYMFVVDGKQWITDPLASEAAGDGFGANNAVLDVGETL